MPGNHGPEPTIAPRQPPLSHAGVRRFSRGYSCQLRLYLNWYEFEPNYNCISRKVKCFLRFSGEYLAFFRFRWYNSQYCTEIGTKIIMETYRSGHNENDSKSFDPQGSVGSNPTVSASSKTPLLARNPALQRGFLAGRGVFSLSNRTRFAGRRLDENKTFGTGSFPSD